jgi:hypothetical protein
MLFLAGSAPNSFEHMTTLFGSTAACAAARATDTQNIEIQQEEFIFRTGREGYTQYRIEAHSVAVAVELNIIEGIEKPFLPDNFLHPVYEPSGFPFRLLPVRGFGQSDNS